VEFDDLAAHEIRVGVRYMIDYRDELTSGRRGVPAPCAVSASHESRDILTGLGRTHMAFGGTPLPNEGRLSGRVGG
jgi:hypothetical protein